MVESDLGEKRAQRELNPSVRTLPVCLPELSANRAVEVRVRNQAATDREEIETTTSQTCPWRIAELGQNQVFFGFDSMPECAMSSSFSFI